MKQILSSLKLVSATAGLMLLPTLASASSNLESDDFVGISFWLISMALVASTAFFFLETQRVEGKWKTSLTVSGLVTLVAAVHYFYMRDVWVETGSTPLVYRYIDWLIKAGIHGLSQSEDRVDVIAVGLGFAHSDIDVVAGIA